MIRSSLRVCPLLLALALPALPAAAEVFYVTLTNGSVIETAKQPQEASWDGNMVLLMTDVGNWIGVPKAEIDNVRSETENKGYGVKINDHAIALGWAPNDNPIPEDGKAAPGDGPDPVADAMDRLATQREAESRYTVEQFVEPNSTQGVPSRFIGYSGATQNPPN
jgi:hypothetical protein